MRDMELVNHPSILVTKTEESSRGIRSNHFRGLLKDLEDYNTRKKKRKIMKSNHLKACQ